MSRPCSPAARPSTDVEAPRSQFGQGFRYTQIVSSPDQPGFLKITEAGVRESFAQDLTASEKDVVFATQSPTAGAALGENVTKPAWKSKPSWYLVATADRAIQPDLEKAMTKKIKAITIEVKSSHVPMLSLPEETARLIIDAAA